MERTDNIGEQFKHGYGEQFWLNGNHYQGMWSFNKLHGYGIFKTKDSLYVGMF
jgi:hypothetical protein